LKRLKICLKEWHNQHFQNLDCRLAEVKNKISLLDSKAEVSVLSKVEVKELHDLSINLHSLARIQNSVNWQKSRMNWSQEGDANSKKIHCYMSSRRRQNVINMVHVDGTCVEGVHNIRDVVFNYYSSHFKDNGVVRLGVENLHF